MFHYFSCATFVWEMLFATKYSPLKRCELELNLFFFYIKVSSFSAVVGEYEIRHK